MCADKYTGRIEIAFSQGGIRGMKQLSEKVIERPEDVTASF